MDWRPNGFLFSTPDLVRAIFNSEGPESILLSKAACGEVEIFASPLSWNAVLWLIMSTLKVDGKPVYSGSELGALKESLPIVFR
jgi:hypothetical protein